MSACLKCGFTTVSTEKLAICKSRYLHLWHTENCIQTLGSIESLLYVKSMIKKNKKTLV